MSYIRRDKIHGGEGFQVAGEGGMLFMAIFNYAPEDRDRVIQRSEQLPDVPGTDMKGEWFDVTGHRVFRLFEAEDEAHLAAAVFQWTDLGVAEVVPVMETKKALKLLRRTAKKP